MAAPMLPKIAMPRAPPNSALVSDMADEGLVLVHRPASPGDRPDLALLERVLYGLRTI